jgi:hypothetical protein
MARAFTLPDLGEGIHEAEIQEVLVKEGAPVEEGDAILAVEQTKPWLRSLRPTLVPLLRSMWRPVRWYRWEMC